MPIKTFGNYYFSLKYLMDAKFMRISDDIFERNIWLGMMNCIYMYAVRNIVISDLLMKLIAD